MKGGESEEGGEELEQYVLTMATGTLLYFHLLIVIAATKKKKAQVETNVYADQTTGTELN